MKKILFVLTVLLLAAPAMAVVNINAVQSGTDPCQVYITYSNTEDSNVRAFALDIWVDDGNILNIADYNKGECNSTVQGYGIFMGTIVIDGTGAVTNDGTPIAEVADLPSDTLPGLDSNGVTTEMGSLYEAGVVSGPKQTGTLGKLILSKVPCNLCIRTNVSRAGIVLENGSSSEDSGPPFTTNLPLCEAIAGLGCSTCAGDWDEDGTVELSDMYYIGGRLTYADYLDNRPEFYYIAPDEPNTGGLWEICCDYDKDGDIDLSDLYTMAGHLTYADYLSSEPQHYEFVCGDPNIPSP